MAYFLQSREGGVLSQTGDPTGVKNTLPTMGFLVFVVASACSFFRVHHVAPAAVYVANSKIVIAIYR